MTGVKYYATSHSINPVDGKPMPNMQLTGSIALDDETITVSSDTAKGFSSIPTGAKRVVVTTETADMRYWVSGSTPTATQGHLVKAGGSFELDASGQIANFKAISVSGTATLQVSYF